MPTLLVFQGGAMKGQLLGTVPRSRLEKWVAETVGV
jgi:hypothetical protein